MPHCTLASAAWLTASAATAFWAVVRSHQVERTIAAPSPGLRVLLVRPCAGLEPHLERALSSTLAVETTSAMRVRFAIASPDDPARGAADGAASRLREVGMDARVLITGACGPNGKADQLARVIAGEPAADVLVVADSDVDLGALDVEALLAPLSDPGVAATWMPPVEVAARTLADRASAAVLDRSLHAFSLLGALDPNGLVGKLMAMRADALPAIGGFSALRRHLGEDMEIARRLHVAGMRVARVPGAARSLAAGRSWAQAIARYARWITVIRAQRPHLLWSYPMLLSPTLPLLAASLVLCALEGPLALWVGAGAMVLRLAVGAAARLRSHRPLAWRTLAVDALLADVLLWAAFVRALATHRVVWRGAKLRIGRGGLLWPLTPPSGRRRRQGEAAPAHEQRGGDAVEEADAALVQ